MNVKQGEVMKVEIVGRNIYPDGRVEETVLGDTELRAGHMEDFKRVPGLLREITKALDVAANLDPASSLMLLELLEEKLAQMEAKRNG